MLPCRNRLPLLAGIVLACLSGGPHAADEGVPVVVSPVSQQAIYRQVQVTGSVTSPQVASLSPATAGLVTEVLAEEGDRVSAGDPLLRLDAELAELQLQSASAEHEQATSALTDARRRLREAEALAPQQSIAETAVRALEAEVAADQAALDRTAADAGYRRALLARHELRAPFAGVISRKLTAPGEWVAQGQGVFELVATEGLRLDFAVAEDYLSALGEDSLVRFSLSARPGEQLAGRVQTIVPVTDTGARTFLLRVVPEDPANAPLLPGLSAQATLLIPDSDAGFAVPRDATLNYPDGRMVVWVVEDGPDGTLAREKVVRPGNAFDGLVEIRGGLDAGDRVVVQGNEALKDGQRIRIVERHRATP
ncbi:efflux RND transporter periplasmic adaptor subunit [Mangrovimicrobium sediminis]|nr:efflux RND transporter periplasmic adaptor subunit [Haliea sp. SAOS-164]